SRLEDAGADVRLRFSLDDPPDADAFGAAVVHPSIFEADAAAADAYLEALSVPVVEATDDTLDRLASVRVQTEPVAPEPVGAEEA
ncbi:hypothetical protein, partial [Klebsiella pneumoniae]|uniref:hypothetical protein n=1 Tax=Klebsiella pneumoniae TaxID=573 RepID=UPI0039C438BC